MNVKNLATLVCVPHRLYKNKRPILCKIIKEQRTFAANCRCIEITKFKAEMRSTLKIVGYKNRKAPVDALTQKISRCKHEYAAHQNGPSASARI